MGTEASHSSAQPEDASTQSSSPRSSMRALILLATLFGCTAYLHPIPQIAVSCDDSLAGRWKCGFQIGDTFKPRIAEAFSKNQALQTVYRQVRTNQTARALFDELVGTAVQRYPKLVAELNGTAAGSSQSFELVMTANLLQELSTGLGAVGAPLVKIGEACSDLLLNTLTSASEQGGAMFVHNEDYGTEFFDTIYFVRMRLRDSQNSSFEIGSFTYPGILPGWAPGWNSHGLAFSWNVLSPSVLRTGGGVAVPFVCRDTLEATSVSDAIVRATPTDLAAGQNLNVGSAITGELVTVETAPGGLHSVQRIVAGSPVQFHANEYFRLKLPQISKNLVSSKHRLAAFERTLPRPDSLQTMLDVLGDTTDAAYPVFRRNDTTHEDTLFTIAFDLRSKIVSVFRGNPRSPHSLLWKESPWFAEEMQ